MSNASDESIAHRFDTFISPRLWQAGPRAQRRGGTAGLLYRRCAALFGVHAIQQMAKRRDGRPDGCAAVPAPVPAPPQPYWAQLRRCGRRRDVAPSVARAARQGRQYRRTLMSAAAHPLRRRYSNRRVLRFSRVRPLVPNHASPNKRGGPVCQRGDDVGEVPGSVGKTAHEEECAWPGFVAQVVLRRVVWGARRSPNLCWCPASRLPIAGMSTRTCWLRAAWLISYWGPFPLHTSTSSK